MSAVTRLLGFGLCLLGAFTIGYVQGVQASAPTIKDVVGQAASSIPSLLPIIEPSITSYIQQNVIPFMDPLLAIGIAMAIGGVALVVRGDGKPRSAREEAPAQPQAVPVKQQ